LLAAPQVIISPPSDALITKLLAKHFSDRQVMVEAGVVSYISARIERSHQAVHDVVSLIDTQALRAKKKVSLPLVRKVLGNTAPNPD
ncbi:MAG: HdaA/DnaA family protein, partial [Alphaproteobacteria bacterium]